MDCTDGWTEWCEEGFAEDSDNGSDDGVEYGAADRAADAYLEAPDGVLGLEDDFLLVGAADGLPF
jgi:hypothetical protein